MTNLKMMCMAFLLTTLVGCNQTMPKKPTKPTLTIQNERTGGICLDKQNATELGKYILDLERGYD